MKFPVVRVAATERDLSAIFDFLIESHVAFGEAEADAVAIAARRLRSIEREMHEIGKAPQQGTMRPDIMPGLRAVTRRRATYYFVVDEELKRVRVLAIFFGNQDHQRRILVRLLERDHRR
jgi:plasmid stabilization system protein ParE